MLYLRTFGALALLDGERSVLPDQRRRLALLVLLAGSGDRGMSRDKLMAFMWPESSTASSRHALHQLLYYLRRRAHPDLFLGTDPLRLNPQVIGSDIVDFESALAEGEAETAAALYRGPFLDGFFLNDASEFEEWVESERGRLARAYTGVLQRLARAADEQGCATLAIDRWRDLTAAGGLDPRAVLGLMHALAAAGDPAGALREARRYEQLARAQLGETPAPDVLAYARELRSQGAVTPAPLAPEELRGQAEVDGPADAEPAFAGRYRLSGRAIRGGMATVFLATDLRHERRVALKLLHIELADAAGTERFLHEIRLTAQLQHPHILPVFDSGESEGRLWFTTPWIEGESLRARLEREGRLPLAHALAIAHQCLEALGYAHRQGVVHRDVKPENILLQEGGALLADFGIATVVTGAAGQQLTEPGVALGTPRYMSPEHAGGGTLDARSDLFSIGAVLFEMLGGVPYAEVSYSRHQDGDIEALLAAIRPAIPARIIAAVLRALQRDPAARYSSAEAFADALTLDPMEVTQKPRARSRRIAAAVAAAAVLALGTAAAVRWWPASPNLDPDLLLVLPFRVSVTDTALRDLGEGALDLMHAKLQSAENLAMVDPHAVIAAWRAGGYAERPINESDALHLSNVFGAGRVLQGAVVGGRNGILLTATLRERVGARRRVSATVEGPADSLLPLFDRLAAELLVRSAGEDEYRLSDLMTRSLPALRNYLAGQAAYRSGRYDYAVARFLRAVDFDSTFALAGLGFLLAAEYKDVALPERGAPARARRARQTPGKLGVRDQRLLYYLEAQGAATLFEGVALWERAVGELPDRVEAWYELGDELYHWGERLGIPNAAARSALALDRALAIDSAFAPALEHRVPLAVRLRDTAVVRRLGARYLAAYPAAASSHYLRWSIAAALGDSIALAGMRRRFRDYSGGALYQIVTSAQQLVVRLDDADAAIAVLQERVAAPGGPPLNANAFDTDIVRRFYLLNRGHARAAASLPEGKTLEQCGSDCLERSYLPIIQGRAAVYDALYWDGDSAAAARSVRRIAVRLASPGQSADARGDSYSDLCALEHWKLAHLDTSTIRRSLAKLRDRATPIPARGAADADDNILCAATLEVLLGVTEGRPDAQAVARLDSIQVRGVWPFFVYHSLGTLALARARELQGDTSGALAVIRRREYGVNVPPFFTTMLREEGRLAAALGDTAGAIKAYRHYLALRATPDSRLVPAAARVRTELKRLGSASLTL